jgi:hypothetical protein
MTHNTQQFELGRQVVLAQQQLACVPPVRGSPIHCIQARTGQNIA